MTFAASAQDVAGGEKREREGGDLVWPVLSLSFDTLAAIKEGGKRNEERGEGGLRTTFSLLEVDTRLPGWRKRKRGSRRKTEGKGEGEGGFFLGFGTSPALPQSPEGRKKKEKKNSRRGKGGNHFPFCIMGRTAGEGKRGKKRKKPSPPHFADLTKGKSEGKGKGERGRPFFHKGEEKKRRVPTPSIPMPARGGGEKKEKRLTSRKRGGKAFLCLSLHFAQDGSKEMLQEKGRRGTTRPASLFLQPRR